MSLSFFALFFKEADLVEIKYVYTLRVFSHSSKYNSNYPSGSLRDPSGNSKLWCNLLRIFGGGASLPNGKNVTLEKRGK